MITANLQIKLYTVTVPSVQEQLETALTYVTSPLINNITTLIHHKENHIPLLVNGNNELVLIILQASDV